MLSHSESLICNFGYTKEFAIQVSASEIYCLTPSVAKAQEVTLFVSVEPQAYMSSESFQFEFYNQIEIDSIYPGGLDMTKTVITFVVLMKESFEA